MKSKLDSGKVIVILESSEEAWQVYGELKGMVALLALLKERLPSSLESLMVHIGSRIVT